MTIEEIKSKVDIVIRDYPVSRVTLFGSRADGTNRENSDVDLIIEFSVPITLLTLSSLRCRLEEELGLDVDVVHGPIRKDDLLEIGKVVELYAA